VQDEGLNPASGCPEKVTPRRSNFLEMLRRSMYIQ
jgi:hypothetical protein